MRVIEVPYIPPKETFEEAIARLSREADEVNRANARKHSEWQSAQFWKRYRGQLLKAWGKDRLEAVEREMARLREMKEAKRKRTAERKAALARGEEWHGRLSADEPPSVQTCKCGATVYQCYPKTRAVLILDADNAKLLRKYEWLTSLKKGTANQWGPPSKNPPLHRLVLRAKAGEFVRSVNGSFLDCRRENLEKKTYRKPRRVSARKKRSVLKGKAGGRGGRGRR